MDDAITEAVRKAFRGFQFEPGTGFRCDLVQYPDSRTGLHNFAVRAYRVTFNNLTERNKLLITEQINELMKAIHMFGVNCILEIWDAPGKPGSKD